MYIYVYIYIYILTYNNMEYYVDAKMTGKLLILCNFNVRHSKILFTEFKIWFGFDFVA